jgi:hypothetical protein
LRARAIGAIRRRPALAVALGTLIALPAFALAHIERASYWPDPAPVFRSVIEAIFLAIEAIFLVIEAIFLVIAAHFLVIQTIFHVIEAH